MPNSSLISRRSLVTVVAATGLMRADPLRKIVDKRTTTKGEEYAIGLAANMVWGGNPGGKPGHAFIIWYYSDQGVRTTRRAAGFYPLEDPENLYELILGVKGAVLDDSRVKPKCEVIFLVDKPVFERAVAIENRYRDGQTYRLVAKDCTSFVNEVADVIPGIQTWFRALHPTPAGLIFQYYYYYTNREQ